MSYVVIGVNNFNFLCSILFIIIYVFKSLFILKVYFFLDDVAASKMGDSVYLPV